MDGGFFQALEDLFAEGNDYLTARHSNRPYAGQDHTSHGERGKQEVSGVTMRDIRDCFVIGAFQAAGFHFDSDSEYRTIYQGTIYDLPWGEMDPGAVMSNALCEVESRMGIYPNLPDRTPRPRED